MHSSMTGYLTRNYTLGEEYTTIREIIHKYEPYFVVSSANVNAYAIPNGGIAPVAGTNVYGIERLGMCFRFNRGSVRCKMFMHGNTSSRNVMNANLNFNGSTISTTAVGNYVNNPILEFEIPYFSSLLFRSNVFGQETLTANKYPVTTPTYLFKAAGDDFSFHWMKAMEMVLIVPSSSALPTTTVSLPGWNAFVIA